MSRQRTTPRVLRDSLAERPVAFAAGIAISVALVVLAFRTLDLVAVAEAVAEMELVWLLPALGAVVVAFFLRALRWQLLFHDPAARPSFREAARALLVGLALNAVLPFRAGDVARILLLHRRTSLPRLQALGTVGVERVYDVLALLVLLVVAVPWLPETVWLDRVAVAGAVAAAAVAALSVALVGWGERVARLLVWPLRWLPRVTEERRLGAEQSVLAGVAALRQVRPAATAVALTLATWLVFWLSYWLLLQGFDLEVGAAAALLVLVATGFGLALPSGPGAVGVFEAAVVVALLPFDVPVERALSYALVLHALNLVPYVVGGLAVFPRGRG